MARRSISVVIAAVGLALAACSQTEDGNASPETGASSPAPSTGAGATTSNDVPTVNNPLDPSPFMSNPCKLVDSAELAELGYTEPGSVQDSSKGTAGALGGPACGWNSDGSEFVIVMLQKAGGRTTGLQNAYNNYKAGRLAYWEPTTVGEYPAAFTSALDDRGNGGCGLTVGIADDLTFSAAADFYVDDPDQACQVAKTLAESVVETLKRGGS